MHSYFCLLMIFSNPNISFSLSGAGCNGWAQKLEWASQNDLKEWEELPYFLETSRTTAILFKIMKRIQIPQSCKITLFKGRVWTGRKLDASKNRKWEAWEIFPLAQKWYVYHQLVELEQRLPTVQFMISWTEAEKLWTRGHRNRSMFPSHGKQMLHVNDHLLDWPARQLFGEVQNTVSR